MVKNAFALAETVLGQQLDMDGVYPGECADLAVWVGLQYGVRIWGDGNTIGAANGPELTNVADVIPYTPEVSLQVGDMLSLGSYYGQYGHVLMYGGGPLSNALIIDQNYGGVKRVQKRTGAIHDILRVVRFKNQETHSTGTSPNTPATQVTNTIHQQVPEIFKKVHEITCAEVRGIKGNGDETVLDIFYKCNKVIGEFKGDWFIYRRHTGEVGYIPAKCVAKESSNTKDPIWKPTKTVNTHTKFPEETYDGISQKGTQIILSVQEFIKRGRVEYLGFEWFYATKEKFTKKIASKLNAHGFLVDSSNRIILSMPESYQAVEGTVLKTPFGAEGVVRASHTEGNEIIVYIR